MHFTRAAQIVNSIRDEQWTHEAPSWANEYFPDGRRAYDGTPSFDEDTVAYTRAVQTAEAFIAMFQEFNPRFNRDKFLSACGLVGE